MKLTRDLVVLSVALLMLYGWRHRRVPPPKPTFQGPAPTLAMPAPSKAPLKTEDGGAMLVAKEDLGGKDVHAPGQRPRPKALGKTPRMLSDAAAPSYDDPAAPPPPDPVPSWLDRVATPKGMAMVAALFVLCYLVLGRALRKGPGGHGMTHT